MTSMLNFSAFEGFLIFFGIPFVIYSFCMLVIYAILSLLKLRKFRYYFLAAILVSVIGVAIESNSFSSFYNNLPQYASAFLGLLSAVFIFWHHVVKVSNEGIIKDKNEG